MDNAEIKKNIYKKRLEKGYSQSKVAGMMNISQTSYQKIEKGGTSLISERIPQLASILELSETELVLGYLPNEKTHSKEMEDLHQESLLKEASLIEDFKRQLAERDKTIETLEGIIKDKIVIINYLQEKEREQENLKQPQG